MSKVTIEDPEIHGTKNVDSNGRLYLGEQYANDRVRVTVELVDE